jgi:alkanesulfonate monooxygenase SsuD/methylene tetrahydromethanopterin reductase-like flavin-dependent oxidoreductase (luciferase family)
VTEYGLLLPHFGEHADPKKIIDGARTAEFLGFDSVWVRDHLLFEPHGEFERPDATFYEALTTLTAVGASTTTLKLGTGALIPFRHPLHTALTAATMTKFFGPRLILGLGSGNFDHEFAAVGLGGVPRPELVEKNVRIMRKVWTESGVDWSDDVFSFADATIHPRPDGGPVPLWYCGNTPRSARLAVDFCDGWLPGRIGIDTLRARVALLTERSAEQGRPRPTVGMIPPTSIATDRDTALSRVNVDGLLTWANKARFWVRPPAGEFRTVEDLGGVLVYGAPEDVVEQTAALADSGADHIVFDLRFTFDRWEEQLDLLGTEVLPKLRPASG